MVQRKDLLPDEAADIMEAAKTLIADPQLWLDTPHELLGGKTPNEAIQQGEEQLVRDLLRAIQYGVMT